MKKKHYKQKKNIVAQDIALELSKKIDNNFTVSKNFI